MTRTTNEEGRCTSCGAPFHERVYPINPRWLEALLSAASEDGMFISPRTYEDLLPFQHRISRSCEFRVRRLLVREALQHTAFSSFVEAAKEAEQVCNDAANGEKVPFYKWRALHWKVHSSRKDRFAISTTNDPVVLSAIDAVTHAVRVTNPLAITIAFRALHECLRAKAGSRGHLEHLLDEIVYEVAKDLNSASITQEQREEDLAAWKAARTDEEAKPPKP